MAILPAIFSHLPCVLSGAQICSGWRLEQTNGMSDIVTASEMRSTSNCKHNLFHMVWGEASNLNLAWSIVPDGLAYYTMFIYDDLFWLIEPHGLAYHSHPPTFCDTTGAVSQFPNPTLLRSFVKTRKCTIPGDFGTLNTIFLFNVFVIKGLFVLH